VDRMQSTRPRDGRLRKRVQQRGRIHAAAERDGKVAGRQPSQVLRQRVDMVHARMLPEWLVGGIALG